MEMHGVKGDSNGGELRFGRQVGNYRAVNSYQNSLKVRPSEPG